MYENIRVIPMTSLCMSVYIGNAICLGSVIGSVHFHMKSLFGNTKIEGKSAIVIA